MLLLALLGEMLPNFRTAGSNFNVGEVVVVALFFLRYFGYFGHW